MKIKKGMASLYLVAFTTLLLGIVTMSFARVMISESREASNSDLSQSAFDSALAGIEDAKTAILMYEACQNSSSDREMGGNGQRCSDVEAKMIAAFKNGNCDVAQSIINGKETTGEVVVSETLDQAYTCVPIANDSPTYRSILNEDTRSRVIPAKFEGERYKDIVGIELQWHSPNSSTDVEEGVSFMDENTTDNFIPFGTKDAALETAPVLAFELFQTDANFTMAELDLNNNDNSGTDHAMIVLYPYNVIENDEKGTFVSSRNLLDASNKSNQAALKSNNAKDSVVPKLVSCGYYSGNYDKYDGGSHCRATIEFPKTYRGGERAKLTFMFRVSLPYGTPQTDFSIKACTKIANNRCTETVNFSGAQYIIDSTGRASTLYRRIIARVETAPAASFPEYAVQVSGNNSMVEKNFWVTDNCWSTDGKGNSSTCANNGDVN